MLPTRDSRRPAPLLHRRPAIHRRSRKGVRNAGKFAGRHTAPAQATGRPGGCAILAPARATGEGVRLAVGAIAMATNVPTSSATLSQRRVAAPLNVETVANGPLGRRTEVPFDLRWHGARAVLTLLAAVAYIALLFRCLASLSVLLALQIVYLPAQVVDGNRLLVGLRRTPCRLVLVLQAR